MKRTIKLLALGSLLALVFPFVGCEKEMDEGDGMIEIFAETMGSNSKVRLDDTNSTWENGDPICINGENVSVVRGDNNRAYISYANPQSVKRAVYPASLAANSNMGGDNITLTFPAYYHYRTDASGHQLLELPMAARSEGNASLKFRHLTGALYVTVKNTATVPLILQSVTVASTKYKLSGRKVIYFDNLENTGSVVGDDINVNEKKVALFFDTGYTLQSNESVKVMIPIMPVGSDHRFSIQVKSHKAGQSTSYLKTQYQAAPSDERDNSLQRNQLGYAPIDIVDNGSPTSVLELVSGKYLVRSPLEFKMMVEAIQNQWLENNAYYSITENIDMSGLPISTITNTAFVGVIDGQNHAIKNLTINSETDGSSYYCALFKQVGTSIVIKNILFDNLTLYAQNVGNRSLYIASLSATSTGNGTLAISNCDVSGLTVNDGGVTGNVYFGGLLGEVYSKTEISDCSVSFSNGNSTGGKDIWFGGFIAYCGSYNTRIADSEYEGIITLNATRNLNAGGFIGRKNYSTFNSQRSSASGSITATAAEEGNNYLGSLIGYYDSPAQTDTANVSKNVSLRLNGTSVTSKPYGNN